MTPILRIASMALAAGCLTLPVKGADQAPPRGAPTPRPEYPLESASPLNLRDGLPNVAEKLRKGGEVNIVFLGGSITVAGSTPAGFVTFVTNWLKEQYPGATIHVINSGISGTGSDFGATRYARDVLAKKPDLVLIEFCVNDGVNIPPAPMERMVHKTWREDPQTDIAIFYTLDKRHLDFYKEGKLPPSASVHERVAAFYGIPTIGTALHAATKINSGEIPWSSFSDDGCHPNPGGYGYFNEVFGMALPPLLAAAPAKAHALGKSITPNLQVDSPPIVVKPLEFKGEFVTAKGEKAAKVYPLPVPGRHWVAEPVFNAPDGKPVWRLAWIPKTAGKKLDPAFGADRSLWESRAMDWFEDGGFFTGPEGTPLLSAHKKGAILGIQRREIGVLRFIAPETGRYAISVKSAPWADCKEAGKARSFNVLKFGWDGKPGESLAFTKETGTETGGLSLDIETHLLAGEEIVFVPDTNHIVAFWNALELLVGFLGPLAPNGANLSPNGAASHSPGQAPAPPWVLGKRSICPVGAASQNRLKLVPFPFDPSTREGFPAPRS